MLIEIISTAVITTILVLWISGVHKELFLLKQSFENVLNQLQMHKELMLKTRGDPVVENQSELMFEISRKIYNVNIKNYNRVIRKPYIYPIAFILGYHLKNQVTKDFSEKK